MNSVLVVGSIAFDTIHGPSGTFPRVLGGSATYASVASAIFAPTCLVGVVGKDFPESAQKLLKNRRVDLAGLEVADGLTFHWEGRYTDDLSARETLKTELNVFSSFRPIIPASQRQTPFVMLGNIDPELQLDVLNQLEKPKLVVADTMNYWITGKPEALAKTLARVNVLVVNVEEARQLAGAYNIAHVAKSLQAMGPETVVIKQGEYGAVLFHKDEIFCAPAYPVREVCDPTGAGDTFAGGLIGYLASRGDISSGCMRQAVIYGSALASFCVEAMGLGRLEHITKPEIDARYATFRDLVHFPAEIAAVHSEAKKISAHI